MKRGVVSHMPNQSSPTRGSRRVARAAGLVVCSLALCSVVSAQRGFHVAEGIEVRIKPPAKWTYLGAEGDLGSLRALFCSPREYASRGTGDMHTPTLRLLWFPKRVAKEASAPKEAKPAKKPAKKPAEEAPNEKPKADPKTPLPRRRPYRDTKDYLDRVNGPLGTVVLTEKAKLGKLSGHLAVVGFPRPSGDLTLHLASIEMPTGELVVEFELLTEQYSKRLKRQFKKCFESLSLTAKEKIKPRIALGVPKWESDPESWGEMSSTKRAKYRLDWGVRWLAVRRLEYAPGWKVARSNSFHVLTRTDAKFTKRIVNAADVARRWVEDRFGSLSDEEVMPATLRIFDSIREETAYRLRETPVNATRMEYSGGNYGTGAHWCGATDSPSADGKDFVPSRVREIYAAKNSGWGNTGEGFGGVIRGVFQQFVHDKHPGILGNRPRWLCEGFTKFTDSSRVKGKKLLFLPADDEILRFREIAESGDWVPTWKFIQELGVPTPKDGAVEPAWTYPLECARLLRWFDEGGSAAFGKEDLLLDYLRGIGAASIGYSLRPDLGVDWQRMLPEATTELRKLMYVHRDEFLVKLNKAVIPISAEKWLAADAKWQAFNLEFAKRKIKRK